MQAYILDQNYQDINCTEQSLEKGEYENCTFRNCSFEYADLSDFSFTDCEFIACNLSMAKLVRTPSEVFISKTVKCSVFS